MRQVGNGQIIGDEFFIYPNIIQTQEFFQTLPLSHDTVMQLILLLDVGMVSAGAVAALTVVTAEGGGQLPLGHAVGGQGDGALLCQTTAVLQQMGRRSS